MPISGISMEGMVSEAGSVGVVLEANRCQEARRSLRVVGVNELVKNAVRAWVRERLFVESPGGVAWAMPVWTGSLYRERPPMLCMAFNRWCRRPEHCQLLNGG